MIEAQHEELGGKGKRRKREEIISNFPLCSMRFPLEKLCSFDENSYFCSIIGNLESKNR